MKTACTGPQLARDSLWRDFLASVNATKKTRFLNHDSNRDSFRSGNGPTETGRLKKRKRRVLATIPAVFMCGNVKPNLMYSLPPSNEASVSATSASIGRRSSSYFRLPNMRRDNGLCAKNSCPCRDQETEPWGQSWNAINLHRNGEEDLTRGI